MTSKFEVTVHGLTVEKTAAGWQVIHAESGVPAWGSGALRQRRFAIEAREELLATGADFTRPRSELAGRGDRKAIQAVLDRWRARTRRAAFDAATFEYYSEYIPWGAFVPSAAWAAAMRDAVAKGSYYEMKRLLNLGNNAMRTKEQQRAAIMRTTRPLRDAELELIRPGLDADLAQLRKTGMDRREDYLAATYAGQEN
jgi:hypothetical protein